MSYSYEAEKPALFTEEGSIKFLKVRDNVNKLLDQSGAVKMGKAISVLTGSVWEMMMYVDRLVELKEIVEITNRSAAGQDRVFVKRGG